MRCCFRTFLFLMSLISMFKQGTEFLTLNKIFVNIMERHTILRLSQMYSL